MSGLPTTREFASNRSNALALYCHRGHYFIRSVLIEDLMDRLKSLVALVVLLNPSVVLVGLTQDVLTIDASKQSPPPARARGPFPRSAIPGHSTGFPIRLELRIPSGPLQPDGTTLVDFMITNVGVETIALPSSVTENAESSTDVLTLWFTSDAIKDSYFKDTTSGRVVKIGIVPTSAELCGRSGDPSSFVLIAPNKTVRVHAFSRVRLQPGRYTATAHAELIRLVVRNSSVSSKVVGTADSEAVTTTLSTTDRTAR